MWQPWRRIAGDLKHVAENWSVMNMIVAKKVVSAPLRDQIIRRRSVPVWSCLQLQAALVRRIEWAVDEWPVCSLQTERLAIDHCVPCMKSKLACPIWLHEQFKVLASVDNSLHYCCNMSIHNLGPSLKFKLPNALLAISSTSLTLTNQKRIVHREDDLLGVLLSLTTLCHIVLLSQWGSTDQPGLCTIWRPSKDLTGPAHTLPQR